MPTLTLDIKYSKNKGLVMSPFELVQTYMYGIDTRAKDGSVITEDTYDFYIKSAQDEIEKWLDIQLNKGIIRESITFYRNDFQSWGYLQTTYPVNKVFEINGNYVDREVLQYPSDWMSSKKSSVGQFQRRINIVPYNTPQGSPVFYSGLVPNYRLQRYDHTPDYWRIAYCTGFDEIPSDLVNFIGKLAVINIFNLLGDLILGAGIASQSIGIDGLSQSISTTSSAENSGYSSRIKAYLEDLKVSLPRLERHYKGLRATSC